MPKVDVTAEHSTHRAAKHLAKTGRSGQRAPDRSLTTTADPESLGHGCEESLKES